MLTPAVSIETISFDRDIRPRQKSSASRSATGSKMTRICGELREIVLRNQRARKALIQKVEMLSLISKMSQIEMKAGDAIEVGLQKITQNVAIEQFHDEFRILISRLSTDCPG